jgi:alpha-glucosidase (family GH31 glycosyl hydrolase)
MMAATIFNQSSGKDSTHKNERQFILSRSTFPSSGIYSSHSLGANKRTWESLKYSIAGVMNFNMFGIPHVGADVCGYVGSNTDAELCARWYQLSTFYPLARYNQNDKYNGQDDSAHEPYTMTDLWGQMA